MSKLSKLSDGGTLFKVDNGTQELDSWGICGICPFLLDKPAPCAGCATPAQLDHLDHLGLSLVKFGISNGLTGG